MVGPVGWGVDLGTRAAYSAVVADWLKFGARACLSAFPNLPRLDERGRRDGVDGLYRGVLTLGRRAVDVELLLRVALDRFGRLSVVVVDRWRDAELRDGLDEARIPIRRSRRVGWGLGRWGGCAAV